MKKINALLGGFIILYSSFSLQGMLTKINRVPRKGWAMPTFQQTKRGITVTIKDSNEIGWKALAHPSQRFLTSFIPFTHAWYDYQKKDKALAQFRFNLDSWEEIICQKYFTKLEKDTALEKLLNGMRSFNVQFISDYKKEMIVYTAALLTKCFGWIEDNKGTERSKFIEALLEYLKLIETNVPGNINYNLIQREYPFFDALNEYIKRFFKEEQAKKQKQQYQQSGQRAGQQGGTRQEQNKFSSAFPKGQQTKKILGLPENASDSQVRASRNKFLLDNHPDVTKNLVSKGIMTQTEANRRNAAVVQLNLAYGREYESNRE